MQGPVWMPTLSSSGRPATAACAARPARTAAAGPVKTAMIASPIAFTTAPPSAADAARAGAEPDGQAPLLGRGGQLLCHDVRRELRPADAEVTLVDGSDGRARREGDLDRPVELRLEVDPTGLAVDAGVELPQRRGSRGRA